MTIITNLLKIALKNHYPRNHKKIGNDEYSSLTEKYQEWFTSIYVNGSYYFGENVPTSISTLPREVQKVFLIKNPGSATENKYGVGVVVQGFKSNQVLKVRLPDIYPNTTFEYKNYKTIDREESISIYGELLSPYPIRKMEIWADSTIDNHLTYSSIPSTIYKEGIYDGEEYHVNTMDYESFMNHYTETMSRINYIWKSYNTSTNELTLEFVILDQTKGTVYLYPQDNYYQTIVFEDWESSVSFTNSQLKNYTTCFISFEDGLGVYFNMDTVNNDEGKEITDYIVQFI